MEEVSIFIHFVYLANLGAVEKFLESAEKVFNKAVSNVLTIHSTRAMAFIIKGIYLSNLHQNSFTKISPSLVTNISTAKIPVTFSA